MLLWAPARRDVARVAVGLAVLWAALVLTLSESSFAALLVGLAALAALRWKAWPVLAVCAAGIAVGLVLVLAAPGSLGLRTDSFAAINEASSGRAKLLRGGVRMAEDRPVWGFGSGSFADQYRERERVVSSRISAESHTIPVTIAAEQGIVGLAAYGFLLWSAFALVFGGLRRHAAAAPGGGRARGALRGGGRVLRAAAAHARLRRLPRGPAHLDPARDGRGAAARGAASRDTRAGAAASVLEGRAKPVPT